MAMNHRRYIGCTVYWAIPFNPTGSIRNVAGGKIAAPTCRCEVMPFIPTGYIRCASGTAHRPFPTVSLTGPFFQPPWLKTDTFVNLITEAARQIQAGCLSFYDGLGSYFWAPLTRPFFRPSLVPLTRPLARPWTMPFA